MQTHVKDLYGKLSHEQKHKLPYEKETVIEEEIKSAQLADSHKGLEKASDGGDAGDLDRSQATHPKAVGAKPKQVKETKETEIAQPPPVVEPSVLKNLKE